MTSSSNKPASSMAELMAKHGKDIHTLKKGQEVAGVVTSLDSSGIILRINNATDVMVLEKDRRLFKQLLSWLTVGDSVNGTVLYPESDSGYPLVTLRAFMETKMWEQLATLQKSGAKVMATVTDITKGGVVVETDLGMSGFLPNSHIASGTKPEALLDKKIEVHIAELNKSAKKIVFSQKESLTLEDFHTLASQYKNGTKVEGIVSGITQFGIFVSLSFKKEEITMTVDGLVHISEISWEKVEDIQNMFKIGQIVSTVVIGFDQRSKRIDLSMKRLSADPFQNIIDAFPAEKKVTGKIVEMTELGVVVDLGDVGGMSVEGLIKKDKIPAGTTYTPEQNVTATVVSVDARKRKVMLTPVLLEKPLMYR